MNSQEKALAAISQGKFKEEIVPVQVMRGKGSPMIFDQDEHPRRLSMAQLLSWSLCSKKMEQSQPVILPEGMTERLQ